MVIKWKDVISSIMKKATSYEEAYDAIADAIQAHKTSKMEQSMASSKTQEKDLNGKSIYKATVITPRDVLSFDVVIDSSLDVVVDDDVEPEKETVDKLETAIKTELEWRLNAYGIEAGWNLEHYAKRHILE